MRAATILLLSAALATGAQPEAKPATRPKVGLVLAGGSALGLAHIGVIRWLEEHRVPVDYVAGTSMGGLVGGLYASGYDAKQVAEFFHAIDWARTLQINASFGDMSFRRKEDRRQFPNALEFGLKKGLKLPPGLSAGHGAGLLISKATAPYAGLKSFDELPTPFRCVAVDLVKGEEVVFSGGPLFDALRATMSLPGVFSPLRLGNQILVDGGVLNNLPIDVAKAMGAEVIIAVGIDSPSARDAYYDNLLAVAKRSLGIMVSANEKRNIKSLRDSDLLLLPDLTGFSSGSFDRSQALAERGYAEANRKARFLETLTTSQTEWAAYIAKRGRRRRPDTIQPKFVEVEGMSLASNQQVVQSLMEEVTKSFDRSALEDKLTEIAGLGRYEAADYRFVRRDGQDGLQVRVREKGYGPPFLNTGLFISGSNSEGLKLGLGARLTFLDALTPGSEWRSDFSLGTDNRLASEYYYRVKGTHFFAAPNGFWYQRSQNFYNGGNKALFSYKVREAGGNFDVGYAAGRYSELRLGYKVSRLHSFVTTGTAALESLSGMVGATRLKFTRDTTDSIVPLNGHYVNFEGQWVNRWPGERKDFPILEARIGWAKQIGERYSILDSMSGGTTIKSTIGLPPFMLGGPLRMSALARNQLIGNHYYYNGFFLMRSLSGEDLSFLSRFRAMIGYELGNVFSAGGPPRPLNSGVIGLIGETGIGVISIGGSFGERGDRKVFLSVGRFF